MKKKWTVVSLIIILMQSFTPLLGIAETLEQPTNKMQLNEVSIKDATNVNPEHIDITVTGEAHIETRVEETITLDEHLQPLHTEGDVLGSEQRVIGAFVIKDNNAVITFADVYSGPFTFRFTTKLQESQQSSIKISYKEKMIETPIHVEKSTNEAEENKPNSILVTPRDATENKKEASIQEKREPVNIDDLFLEKELPFFTKFLINGKPVTVDPIEHHIGDPINMSFSFDIPDEIRREMQAGDYYEVQIPKEIEFDQNVTIELADEEGNVYGIAKVDTEGKLKITFTEIVENMSNIHGELELNGKLGESSLEGPGNHDIHFPWMEENEGYPIIVKPHGGTSISKSGHPDRPVNPREIVWDVDINTDMNHLTNPTITEKFPKGTHYQSVVVYRAKVDFNGEIRADQLEELASDEYAVDVQGNVTIYGETSDAYKIRYTTEIEADSKPGAEGGTISYKNEASLKDDAMTKEIDTSATITGQYYKAVEKFSPSYDAKNQQFSWMVRYNYNEATIPQGKANLSDRFKGNMKLIEGSVALYKVTFNEQGYPVRGAALVEEKDYQFVNSGDGFELHFLHDIDYAVDLSYTTSVDEEVIHSQNYGNEIEDGQGHTGESTGVAEQQSLIKNLKSVDYATKLAMWEIEVNQNQYEMHHWQMEDTLSVGLHLPLLGRKFQIFDRDRAKEPEAGEAPGYVLKKEADYTFVYDEKTRKINVQFIGDYAVTDHRFTIQYVTEFDTAELNEAGETFFYNYVAADWQTKDGENKHVTDHRELYPKVEDSTDGFKFGFYNAKTKKIEWRLGINYNKQTLGKVTVTDPISDNQNYVKGSLKIYKYRINANGSYDFKELVQGEEYEKFHVVEPTQALNQLMITIDDVGANDQYGFTFETSLEGEIIHDGANYHNVATIHASNVKEDFKIEGDVAIQHGGGFVSKAGTQDSDGFLNWKATINASQSTVWNPKIVDTPTPNQIIEEGSIQLFETKVNTTGKLDKGKELVKGKDYFVAISTDDETGQQQMIITFPNDPKTGNNVIDRAYMLEYKAFAMLENPSGEKTSNGIKLEGERLETEQTETEGSINAHINGGSGSAVGERGSLTIKKTDAQGNPLKGAKFQLWNQAKTAMMREGEVDENGLLKLGPIPYGPYFLVETEAPAGHTIDDDLSHWGRWVEVNKESSADKAVYTIVNQKNRVEVKKVNEEGVALAGATFVVKDSKGKKIATGITDTRGIATIEGLLPGKYTVQEIKAPNGYLLNTTETSFEVRKEDNGQVSVVTVGPVVNYLGSAFLIKQDEMGKGLKDATFSLTRVKDKEDKEVNEKLPNTFTSDETGRVSFTKLAPGTYQVEEINAPTGFLVNKETKTFTIKNEANTQPAPIKIGNLINYKGSIELEKQNEQGDKLAGAEFKLLNAKKEEIQTGITSNQSGKIRINHIGSGVHYLVETKAPEGYVLNTEPYEFSLDQKETVGKPEVQVLKTPFVNYKGSAVMKKVNGKREALAGAEFSLYLVSDTSNSHPLQTITSDKTGAIKVDNLAPGLYKLIETKAPIDAKGNTYVKNSYPRFFSVGGEMTGKPETIELGEFQNFLGNVNISKQDGTGKGLKGAEFTLYKLLENDQEELVQEKIASDGTGKLALPKMGAGYYKLVETKAPEGRVKNENPIFITVEESSTSNPSNEETFVFNNFEGKISFIKTNEDGKGLEGAVFALYLEVPGKEPQLINDHLTDDGKGNFEQAGLSNGTYILKEVTAPKGYILSQSDYKFEMTESSDKEVLMELGEYKNYQGDVSFKKTDSEGYPLAGATFALVDKEGTAIKDASGKAIVQESDKKGRVRFEHLAPGDYKIKEIVAPKGFVLNQKELQFTIAEKTQDGKDSQDLGTFVNYKGALHFTKTDENHKVLAGAEFTLFDKSGETPVEIDGHVVRVTSGENGVVSIDNIPVGSYIVKETKAPTGYLKNEKELPFEIQKTAMDEPKVIELNEFVNYKKAIQVLKTNKKGQTLAGAEFTLFDVKGNPVSTAVSNEQGIAQFTGLAPGDYRLKETKAPDGYMINSKVLPIVVEKSAVEKPIIEVVATYRNYQGTIELIKEDAVGNVLPGAEFTLYTADGKEVTNKDNQPIVGTSDKNGKVLLSHLAPGEYVLKETKAPTGFVLEKEEITFTIADDANEEPPVQKLTNVINYQGTVSIVKTNEAGERLANATFTMYDEKGDKVNDVISDKKGTAIFTGLAPGNYTVKETKAPEGYILNTEVKKVRIESQSKGRPDTITIDSFINYKGTVHITKVDEKDLQQTLDGAEFSLFDKEDKIVARKLVTDENGEILIDRLAPGKYQLKETKAPDGYKISAKRYEFEIEKEAENKPKQVEIIVTNQKIPIHLQKKKQQSSLPQTGESIGQSILSIVGALLLLGIILYGYIRKKSGF